MSVIMLITLVPSSVEVVQMSGQRVTWIYWLSLYQTRCRGVWGEMRCRDIIGKRVTSISISCKRNRKETTCYVISLMGRFFGSILRKMLRKTKDRFSTIVRILFFSWITWKSKIRAINWFTFTTPDDSKASVIRKELWESRYNAYGLRA